MADIKSLIESQRVFFNSGKTKSIDFRIEQLKKLKRVILDNETNLHNAIFADFKKSPFDNYSSELAILYIEIDNAIKKVKRWAGFKRAGTNLANFPAKSYIIPEPLGVSLIIGAWNYPYQLSIGPAIAAIAAGNTVVLKPSELPAHTSSLMAEIINNNFDPALFRVVEGGVPETEELLNLRFDKIFFTGSVNVGRIVYMAAARHLTPVTLELGGKSPAFILDDANMAIYVKRLVWAKFFNAGQTCIAPDYVLVQESLKDKFVKMAISEIKKERFSVENSNYVQIINERNILRLSKMVDSAKIVFGGGFDVESRIFEPTIIDNVSFDDAVMQEEIFGPILPVISFKSLDDVIREVKEREKPLSCYIFTVNKQLKRKILNEISFGGGCVNDAIMHVSNDYLPFGGVGESGIGSYHGEYGFKSFSHYKSILEKSTWFEPNLKYYPRTALKFTILKKILKLM
jgi:aldehyde dehydrogenase (NAD+)